MTNPLDVLFEKFPVPPMKLLTPPCPFCGSVGAFSVPREDLASYRAGGSVQACFPYLSADDRERLVSGICPPCWEKEIGEEDENE